MRRLDPWAALLLGGLLAMGVVILLATPGPWQKVVGKQPPVRLEAPTPDDVAVFVMGGRGGACSGVLWLHLDAERNSLAAIVVAPRVSGFSPTDGYAPVAAIADGAGPSAAAAGAGRSARREHGRLGGPRPQGVRPGDPGDVPGQRAARRAHALP